MCGDPISVAKGDPALNERTVEYVYKDVIVQFYRDLVTEVIRR
jgi:hypothetical protein